MATYDLRHLLDTVEQVRAEIHPEVSAALLEAVIRAEDEHSDDPEAALKAAEAAIERFLVVGGQG